MSTVDLDVPWSLAFGPQTADAPMTWEEAVRAGWAPIPACVPGNVECDLLAAGLIDEPSVGNHIYDLRPFETCRWFYRTTFDAPVCAADERVELVFEGLDCLGTITLNGVLVGTTDNMLIAHRFDVTELLRSQEGNELVVRIDSAVLAGRVHQPAPGEFMTGENWEALTIRKAPHMYGWDILPRLVSAGLWRAVRLAVMPPTRWRAIYWATLSAVPATRAAEVVVDWDFQTSRPSVDALQVNITLSRHGRVVHQSTRAVTGTHGRARLRLRDVDLWWPRGSGEAALHEARLELVDSGGMILDTHVAEIGVRTVRLRRTDVTSTEALGEFVFEVNGEKVFARGTNWVPLDALHSRDPQHLGAAVGMLAELNCNMVRCWGGNVYEDHVFFELCDRHGILVWQDFALACAIYPQDDGFAARIRQEAEFIVGKLRNHPSLALWAGNNEIDEAHEWAGMGVDPNTDRLSREVLARVVRCLDPLRDYLPSSPYRSPEFVRRGSHEHLKPEDHLWGPRDDFKGPYYTGSPAHFVSEIGYHGCPARRSLEQMMDADHVWPWRGNDQWLTHAVRPHPATTNYNYRIELMARQVLILFAAEPTELDDFVLASQIVQAEALKFFVERFRMGKWRRTGMLWWNLRDGWPVISDAIVDYYNRKKLAYPVLCRAQANVCAMCAEADGGRHALVVVNDTRAPVTGRLVVRDADTQAVLFDAPCDVPANGSHVCGSVPASPRPACLLLALEIDGTVHPNHYLSGPRPFSLDSFRRWLKAAGLPERC